MIRRRVAIPPVQAVADGPVGATLPPGAFSLIVNAVQVNAGQTIDLGSFLAATSNEQTIYVVNTGGSVLPWDGLSVSGASWFALSQGGAAPLNPNESSQFTVSIVNAAGIPSSQTATVTLTAGALSFVFYLLAARTVASDPPIPGVPAAPTDVVATAGDASILVTWTGAAGAGNHTVYWDTNTGDPYANNSGAISTPTFSYTISPATNGATYYIAVKAGNLAGSSAYSTEVTAMPQDVPPPTVLAAPGNFAVVAGDAQVTVTWSAVVGATGYLINYAPHGQSLSSQVNVAAPATSRIITSLANGQNYDFQMRAYDAVGLGTVTAVLSATPTGIVQPTIGVVTGLAAVAGDAHVHLSWVASDVGNPQRYTIYYGLTQTTLTSTASVNVPATGAVITGLTNGTLYYFGVAIYDGTALQEGDLSSLVSATPVASGGGPGDPPLARALTMNVWAFTAVSLAAEIPITDNITPIIGAYADGSSGVPTDAASLAALVSSSLSVMASGKRAFTLGHIGWGRTDMDDLVQAPTPLSVLNDSWPGEVAWSAWMRTFWAALTTTPNLIVWDQEPGSGGSTVLPHWLNLGSSTAVRAAAMSTIYATTALRRKLPLAMKWAYINGSVRTINSQALAVQAYEQITGPTATNIHLVAEWSRFVLERYLNCLRRVSVRTYLQARGVAAPKALNYSDERSIWEWRDYNRWPMGAGNRSMTEYSSIGAYLTDNAPAGSLFHLDDDGNAREKSVGWNQNIDIVNKLRAQRWPQLPWVSALRYRGEGVAANGDPQRVIDLVHHLGEMGVKDIVWFSPSATDAEVAEFQGVVERIEVKRRPTRQLPPVAWDADEITTGAFTATYVSDEWVV